MNGIVRALKYLAPLCWAFFLIQLLPCGGQTLFWDPDQTDNTFSGNTGTWTTAGNWRNNGNTANVNWANGNIASFQVYRGYVTLGGAVTVDQLFFGNNSGGYRILGGGTITVNGGTDIFVRSDAFTARIENSIQLSAAASTFDMQGGGTLFLTNTITAASQNLTLSANGGDIVASGVIGLGTGSLTKTGTDNLILSAANTYSGGTTIGGTGTVRVQNANGLGAAGGAVALNGGTLSLENITLAAHQINMANGTTLTGTGTTTTSGVVNVAANASVTISTSSNPNDVFTIGTAMDSLIGGTAGVSVITISGNGRVILGTGGGTNAYAGDYLLLSGVLQTPRFNALSNTATTVTFDGGTLEEVGNFSTPAGKNFVINAGGGRFNVVTGATANINATADQITGTGIFTKGNGGVLTVSQNNNLFSGGIVVDGGTLSLTGANGTMTGASGVTVMDGGIFLLNNTALNANRVGNTATLTLQGGTFQLNGAAAATAETIGATTVDVGSNVIDVRINGANSSQLTSASLSQTQGATVNFTNAGGGGTLGNAGNNPRVIFTAAPALTNGLIGGWAYVNNGDFAGYGVNGVQSFAGARTAQVNASVATDNVSIAAAQANLTANRTVNSIRYTGNFANNLGGFTLNVGTGGIMNNTNNPFSITNGILTAGGGSAGDLYFNVTQNSGTVSAVIADNGGAVGLVKSGTGTLVLSGTTANTYSGMTFLNEGTIQLNKTAGVNAIVGNITVGDGFGTDTLQLLASNQIADTGTVTVTRSGVFDLNGNNETIAGLVMEGGNSSGTNGRVQTGAGTLTLGGNVTLNANTHSDGSATITGNLAMGAVTRTFSISDNAVVLRDMDVSAVVSGTGGLTKSGAGRLTLSGTTANTYSGTTTVNAGTLELNKTAGVNAVAGNTIIATGGTLLLGTNNQIADTSNMTLSGGTFNTGGFTETLGTLTLSANSSIDMGEGASVLTFSPTWTPAGNTLTILNWTGLVHGGGSDQIFFGNTKLFTDAQLSMIHFDGYGRGATQLATGEIVPVIPEPATVTGACILIFCGLSYRCKKSKKALFL